MFLPPTCIATYLTSHRRQQCQHDCLLSRRLAAQLARMCYYINYTGCLSVIVLTLNLRNSRSSLVHLPLARSFIHSSIDICHLALSALRILTFSPFPGQRQSLVRARSVLQRRTFLILSLRTSDQLTTSLRFAAF